MTSSAPDLRLHSTWLRRAAGLCVAALLVVAASAPGQETSGDVLPRAAVHGMEWRSIGPAVAGGRLTDLEVVRDGGLTIYAGAASGGVFRSVNHGTSWTPVFDDAANLSVGDITVAPSDHDVIWVGTGEPNNRNSSPVGRGVYRSTDGGDTWTLTGLEATRHVGDVVVHPRDPETAWVAALGHLFGPNEERGVYRTTDGGATWEKVLYVDENTGVVDLQMLPGRPETLLAAAYQRRRRAYGFVGGGSGGGIYRTTNGGDDWRRVTSGLPEADKGRIGFDVVASRPDLVLATVEASEGGGIYRSTDAGRSWEKVNDLNPRPMYYSQIRIDPSDTDRLYVLGTRLHLSEDGGESFREVALSPVYNVGVHSDQHDLWIDPERSEHMILANDGGFYATRDGGENWSFSGNLPIGQFYDVTYDMRTPYRIYGGLQDNQSVVGPSDTRRYKGILDRDWTLVGFGDGMYQQVDPFRPRTLYTSSQGGAIVRFDLRSGDRKDIQPVPRDTATEYRFDWTSPIVASRHVPGTVYLGGSRLFTSRDRGETWSASEDLTRRIDRDTLPIMGAVPDSGVPSLHDGVGGFSEITTVAESPLAPGVLWVGTDDGNVQVSRDGGRSWTEVGAALPVDRRTYVSRVEASHEDPGRAYVTLDGHWRDDYSPHVFVTGDYGRTWRDISPGGDPGAAKVVREHPGDPDVLFLGTSTGVLVTRDGGGTWRRLNLDMPRVPVWDLEIHPREKDLIAGTHGRSIWILDDIEALAGSGRGDGVRLVHAGSGELYQRWNGVPSLGQGYFQGENPDFGAPLTFATPAGVDSVDVVVRAPRDELFDSDTLRHIRAPVEQGLNRVVWNLRLDSLPMDTARYEPPTLAVANRGPLVPPGSYPVEVTGAGSRDEGTVEVVPAPEVPAGPAELRERFRFASELQDLRADLYGPSVRAYELEDAASGAVDSLESAGPGDVDTARADSLLGEIGSAADSLRTLNAELLGWWRGLVGDFTGGPSTQGTMTGPTPSQRHRLRRLQGRLDAAKRRLERVVSEALPELNELLSESGVETVPVPERVRPSGRTPGNFSRGATEGGGDP